MIQAFLMAKIRGDGSNLTIAAQLLAGLIQTGLKKEMNVNCVRKK